MRGGNEDRRVGVRTSGRASGVTNGERFSDIKMARPEARRAVIGARTSPRRAKGRESARVVPDWLADKFGCRVSEDSAARFAIVHD